MLVEELKDLGKVCELTSHDPENPTYPGWGWLVTEPAEITEKAVILQGLVLDVIPAQFVRDHDEVYACHPAQPYSGWYLAAGDVDKIRNAFLEDRNPVGIAWRSKRVDGFIHRIK